MDENTTTTEVLPEPTLPEQPQTPKTTYLLIGAIIMVVGVILFLFVQSNTDQPVDTLPTVPGTYEDTLSESVSGNPVPLQDFIARQLGAGINDDTTRSAIHWVAHRYFDNGGNIYEIYDFIEATPEVAFLKGAEAIYPDMFATIKSSRVENWSYESLMALLAYYEIIDRAGYADLAIWATAANKYAEQAYKNRPNPNDAPEFALERDKYFTMVVGKANEFLRPAKAFIINNTMKTGALEDLLTLPDSVIKDDVLVGLNQYASAVLNLKGAGAQYPTEIDPIALYTFNSTYAERYVPRLYLFTNYSHAVALVYAGEATPETVAAPLSRAVAYMRAQNNQGPGTIKRILDSKINGESGIFQYDTTQKLAELHPDFRAWLLESGWTESDL
jgi:hypothetical protein